MAQLQTYNTNEIVGLTLNGKDSGREPLPGSPVRHRDDKQSYGVCLSSESDGKHRVLWSKQPRVVDLNVQSVPINATSRKLNARWSAELAEDKMVYGIDASSKIAPSKQVFEVEEEYENLSMDEVRRFHEAGAEIEFRSDGSARVKRKTFDIDEIKRDEKLFRQTRTWSISTTRR